MLHPRFVQLVDELAANFLLHQPEVVRLAKPVIPACWPKKLSGSRISLHAARYDRLAPCDGLEFLARTWNAKLTVRPLAHFHPANSSRIFPQIAAEVRNFMQQECASR